MSAFGGVLDRNPTIVLDSAVSLLTNAAGQKNKRWPTVRGQAAVHAALAGLSAQISDVVASVGQQLDAVDNSARGPHKLRAETVELTFGVTFRAGAGKIVEAVLTAGGESSAQIKLVLSRGTRSEDGDG